MTVEPEGYNNDGPQVLPEALFYLPLNAEQSGKVSFPAL